MVDFESLYCEYLQANFNDKLVIKSQIMKTLHKACEEFFRLYVPMYKMKEVSKFNFKESYVSVNYGVFYNTLTLQLEDVSWNEFVEGKVKTDTDARLHNILIVKPKPIGELTLESI